MEAELITETAGPRRVHILVALLLVVNAPIREAWAACGRDGFGTLAYVVSSCRVQGTSLTAWQELRIRRGRCAPVTVVRFASSGPVEDPFGLCEIVAQNHLGNLSSLAGVFQRIGVTLDGSAVVFEVSNQFQLTGRTPLGEQEQGFFWVRSDGTGLRRIGPPSRNPSYRIFLDPQDGDAAASAFTELGFSPDGRWISFGGRGPGPDAVEREQLFVMNTRTGERRQLTSFPAGGPLPAGLPVVGTSGIAHGEVTFLHNIADPDSDISSEVVVVGLDGRRYRTYRFGGVPGDIGGNTIPTFDATAARTKLTMLGRVNRPGTPVNADIFPFPDGITEVVRFIGRHVVQLTNLRATDTAPIAARGRAVLFWSSADPFGTNPWRNQQIFRVSSLGAGLRQLTHFANSEQPGVIVPGDRWGCFQTYINQTLDGSRRHVFYSDCDPFGTNPDGSEIFAIDFQGRLEQLTETPGVRRSADGVLEVEIPGPSARGG